MVRVEMPRKEGLSDVMWWCDTRGDLWIQKAPIMWWLCLICDRVLLYVLYTRKTPVWKRQDVISWLKLKPRLKLLLLRFTIIPWKYNIPTTYRPQHYSTGCFRNNPHFGDQISIQNKYILNVYITQIQYKLC